MWKAALHRGQKVKEILHLLAHFPIQNQELDFIQVEIEWSDLNGHPYAIPACTADA